MNSHKIAKLTPKGREEMIRRLDSMPAAVVAAGFGVSLRTTRKCKSRYRHGGVQTLVDKSSRPLRCRAKLTEKTYREIFSLRQSGLTGDEIAERLRVSRNSVFPALRKLDCSRFASLEVNPPVRPYQGENGQMLRLDNTDNGACYASRKFREACRKFGIQHKRTSPYRPQTKARPNDLSRRH